MQHNVFGAWCTQNMKNTDTITFSHTCKHTHTSIHLSGLETGIENECVTLGIPFVKRY